MVSNHNLGLLSKRDINLGSFVNDFLALLPFSPPPLPLPTECKQDDAPSVLKRTRAVPRTDLGGWKGPAEI